ncbi:MAG: hypothetical protein GWO85_00090 [Simkaniaceae bacterium]|nr:hypothetical protein [Simkaniaceae bacterium]
MNKLIFVIAIFLSGSLMATDCCKNSQKNKDAACGQTDTAVSKDQHMMKKMGNMKGMPGMKGMKMNDEAVYYTCPMASHKHIHSSEPGKCPECGMALVAVEITTAEEADFYGCPMESHSHVRSDKPGTCDECGMKLKPMKLK